MNGSNAPIIVKHGSVTLVKLIVCDVPKLICVLKGGIKLKRLISTASPEAADARYKKRVRRAK